MPKQQQADQSQYALVAVDGEEMYLPVPIALRMSSADNREQDTMAIEIANRGYAIDGHRALGQVAHEGAGRVARVAAKQFHQTAVQHAQMVAASKGLPFVQCEIEFDRLNLQQQMQNHFAINDGVAKNYREQVITPLRQPNQKTKRWWQW